MADSRYKRLRNISAVSPGDQIAVFGTEGVVSYYHQAIVESVDDDSNTFNVMEKMPDGVGRAVYDMGKEDFWKIDNRDRCFSPPEVIARAKSRLGEKQYNLRDDNCEHFTEWCVTGKARSYQIEALPVGALLLLPMVQIKRKGKKI